MLDVAVPSMTTLLVSHRMNQTQAQGIVTMGRLPSVAAMPRQRNPQPLPTNTTCREPMVRFRHIHRAIADKTHAHPMMVKTESTSSR